MAVLPTAREQMSFFGRPSHAPQRRPAPLAAAADPVSSHLAATEVINSGRRAAQKLELLEWLQAQPAPLTSAEIAAASGMDRHMVARRLPDLERDRAVQRGPIRTCSASGRQAVTWRAR